MILFDGGIEPCDLSPLVLSVDILGIPNDVIAFLAITAAEMLAVGRFATPTMLPHARSAPGFHDDASMSVRIA